jgi:ankyrin repeat protein
MSQGSRDANTSSQACSFGSTHFFPSQSGIQSIWQPTWNIQDTQQLISTDDANVTHTSRAVIEPLSEMMKVREGLGISHFSKLMIQMFSQMSLGFQPFSRSLLLIGDTISQCSLENMYSRNTMELLRGQSFDHQMFHMVVYRLINDGSAISALQNPRTANDKFFKIALEHIFLHGSHIIGQCINSTPEPYKDALQHGLFRAAIELGSVPVVEILLSQGFNARAIMAFGRWRCYPLERSCARHDVDMTRILLERGACPEQFNWGFFLGRLYTHKDIHLEGGDAVIEVIRLLVNHGVKICDDAAHYIFQYCDAELFLATTVDPDDHSYKSVVLCGGLAEALRDPNHCPSMQLKIQVILEHEYPQNIQDHMAWNKALNVALSQAALQGNTEIVTMLLAAGAQPDTECLINAAHSKSITIFETLLGLGLDPNAHSPTGWLQDVVKYTPLSICIEKKFVKALDLLDKKGWLAKLKNHPESLATTLAAACKVSDLNLVDRLLSMRKGLKWWGPEPAIAAAIKSGNENLVEHLLCSGVKPDYKSLFLAIKQRNKKLAHSLLHIVSLVRRSGETQDNLLPEAIRWGDTNIVEDLIAAGISVDGQTYIDFGNKNQDWNVDHPCVNSPKHRRWNASNLSLAILRGNREVIRILLGSGAQLHVEKHMYQSEPQPDLPGMSAITACVLMNDYDLLRELLARGADPFDNPAIPMAALGRNENIIKALLEAFRQRYPVGRKSFGSLALALAVRTENLQIIKSLVPFADQQEHISKEELGYPEEDEYLEYDDSPLGLAIRMSAKGRSAPLGILLGQSIDLNRVMATDYCRRATPLLLAVEGGCLDTVQTLIEAGSNVSLPALWGLTRTPLQAAVEEGHTDVVRYLLQKGASTNEFPAPRAGATALQLAAIKGFIGIAATLLDKGANVNAKPALLDGRTAFEGATEHGNLAMMTYLVQNGADLHADNQLQYRQAVEFAENNGHHAAKKLAKDLLQSTWRGAEAQFIEQDDTEPIGFGFNMSDDFLM